MDVAFCMDVIAGTMPIAKLWANCVAGASCVAGNSHAIIGDCHTKASHTKALWTGFKSHNAWERSAEIEFAQRDRKTSTRTISCFPWRTNSLPVELMFN